jgi:hypothetical protein
MYRCLASLVCGVTLIATSAGHAMDYSYRVFGRQIVIDASGEIESDEAARLANWVNAQHWGHRRASTIVFDSGGGNMGGGVDVARIVTRYGLNTGVAHGGMCASACVMAWSVGAHKSSATDAQIGVHMANQGDGKISSDGTLFYANFVKQTGAPSSVVAELISTPPDSVHWLSLAELRAWKTTIVDGEDTVLDRAYRPQPLAPTTTAQQWLPSHTPPDGVTAMPPLLFISLVFVIVPFYLLSGGRRARRRPNLLNRSGKNDPYRRN